VEVSSPAWPKITMGSRTPWQFADLPTMADGAPWHADVLADLARPCGEMPARWTAGLPEESLFLLVLGHLKTPHALLSADTIDDIGLGLHSGRHPVHLDEKGWLRRRAEAQFQ